MATNSLNERMISDEKEFFKSEPRVNVISKEMYEQRVAKVFKLLWSVLSKSFGPYGAPTLINNYPYSHVTKDGFTIMKNLSMDASEQLVDQAIANMASDVCGRLNYAVGDGTTSAVIATYSIYNNYLKYKKELDVNMVMPRDIIYSIKSLKNDIIAELDNYRQSIRSEDPDKLYNNIYNVVYISSNGDDEISNYIASLYKELKFPGISCELATDGITKKRLIDGFKLDLVLNDKLYINSDNDSMIESGCDIIILNVRVTKDVYEKILKPLNEQSRIRGRKLIVCAATYDETALMQTIRRDLTNEYQKNKDINMVLTTYKAVSEHLKTKINDFAVLCNTIIIDRSIRDEIFEKIDSGKNLLEIFNFDSRDDIPNLICLGKDKNGAVRCINSDFTCGKTEKIFELDDSVIRIGYAGNVNIGMKNSTFSDFYYNQNSYEAILKDAEITMRDVEEKYKKLGTFNLVVNQAQQRYYALKLKMGVIEVGGDSELSQKLFKDSVDDAIKAAASAYDHGIILGCNVFLINSISKILEAAENLYKTVPSKKLMTEIIVLKILRDGFVDVYKTVLSNAFDDSELKFMNKEDIKEKFFEIFHEDVLPDDFDNCADAIIANVKKRCEYAEITVHDMIIEISSFMNLVFDVTTKRFTNKVINSTQTDEEIVTATIDLISILMTGNQMVVTQKHNF